MLRLLQIISTCCIIVIALQTSVNTMIYTRFKILQEEISRDECVQRENKTNTCKGNCVLQSQLDDASNEMNTLCSYVKDKIEWYYQSVDLNICSVRFIEKRNYLTHAVSAIRVCSFDIFHPPS